MTETASKEFELPTHLQEYFKNWNEGYNFGRRDAFQKKELPNVFTGEPHGLMCGYIAGYCAMIEKLRGFSVSISTASTFIDNITHGDIKFTPYDEKGSPLDYDEWFKKNGKQQKQTI